MNQSNDTNEHSNVHSNELMELKHDPVPGYKSVFTIVFTLSLIYMAYILFQPRF